MEEYILGKTCENSSKPPKQRITRGDTTIESDTYGLRFDKGYVIGRTPVAFGNDKLIVHNINVDLTEGLLQLLLKRAPQHYEPEDKKILKVTNAHKKLYKSDMSVNANNSWKYKKIISLLFSPKRRSDVNRVETTNN
ncbi:hypothetical protein JTB14_035832 [Gonioctena quinquepunctata]|nr:hypothetical protein JTB14_035832 [Gonioctena quinquepunctata]